jgi:hypothetical protein
LAICSPTARACLEKEVTASSLPKVVSPVALAEWPFALHRAKEQAMHSYPTDLAPTMIAIVVALVVVVIVFHLFRGYRARAPRAPRLLCGTRSQRAALRVALAPVVREFVPLLERAGQEVRAIVLVPTLSSSDGEPLAAEVEQLGASGVFGVRLAHRLGSTVRQPDEVAGALAEDLLFLYRHAAGVTVMRQTGADVAAHGAPAPKPAGRNGLAVLPNHAAQNEADETVTAFKPRPVGSRNGQSS